MEIVEKKHRKIRTILKQRRVARLRKHEVAPYWTPEGFLGCRGRDVCIVIVRSDNSFGVPPRTRRMSPFIVYESKMVIIGRGKGCI